MVQSTNCRACSVYLRVENGVAVAPSKDNSQPRYAKNRDDDPSPASAPRSQPAPATAQSPAAAGAPAAVPTPKKKDLSPLPAPQEELTPEPEEEEAPAPQGASSLPAAPAEKPAGNPSPAQEPANEKSPHEQSELFTKNAEGKRPLPLEAIPSSAANAACEPAPEAPAPPVETQAPLMRPSFLANRPIKPKAPPPPPKPQPIAPEDLAPETEAAPPATQRYRPEPSKTPPPEQHSPIRIAPLINREKKRSVRCFDCDGEHEILADSTSALCPKCGAYIGLKSYDIRDRSNSRIQTRGNVFVHKKGEVTGITIQCHNLTIEGHIQGGAECSGDFIIRKTGKVNGPVTSERVIVERRAIVDFMSGVNAKEVIIDGEVTGSVTCKKLILKKRATLDGDLSVGSLSIEEGARHTGNIKMTGA